MSDFCRLLAFTLCLGSLAFEFFAGWIVLREQYHGMALPVLVLAWLPAVVLPYLRSCGVRLGERVAWESWGSVLAPAAGSLLWVAWVTYVRERNPLNATTLALSGWWFAALVLSAAGLALDRPAAADPESDD